MATATANKPIKSWAEEEAEELPERWESEPDKNGVRTIIEYKLNSAGKKVKITKKVKTVKKTVKVNLKVEERRKWKKFGNARDAPPGPEEGFTGIDENIHLELISKKKEEPETDNLVSLLKARVGQSIKGASAIQEVEKKAPAAYVPPSMKARQEAAAAAPKEAAEEKTEKYVPPSLRGRQPAGAEAAGGASRPEEYATVRVSNLADEITENDLRRLFGRFGPIQRIYLAKDKVTRESKGFAFVNFNRKEDAAEAIAKLNGIGVEHLIISVEWAKPSNQ